MAEVPSHHSCRPTIVGEKSFEDIFKNPLLTGLTFDFCIFEWALKTSSSATRDKSTYKDSSTSVILQLPRFACLAHRSLVGSKLSRSEKHASEKRRDASFIEPFRSFSCPYAFDRLLETDLGLVLGAHK